MRLEKRTEHSFEVLHDIQFYKGNHRPGVIKPGSGHIRAKLSSESERAFFAHLFEDDPSESVHIINKHDVEQEGWSWEPEDEYVLRDVWSKGLDLTRGIIYVRVFSSSTLCILTINIHPEQHHAPGIEVHITLNTARLPRRKGSGNTPYVFRARGAGWRDDDEDEEEAEDAGTLARLDEWNKYNAFSRFLGRFREPPFPPPSSPLSSPTKRRRFSDLSSLPPSSPPRSSPYVSRSSIGPCDLFGPYMLDYRSYPTNTPAPSHPSHCMRLERISQRLEKLTQSGLADMSSTDSNAAKEEDSTEDEDEDEQQRDEERGYRIQLGPSGRLEVSQPRRPAGAMHEQLEGEEVKEVEVGLVEDEEEGAEDEDNVEDEDEPAESWAEFCMNRQQERRMGIFNLRPEDAMAADPEAPCLSDPPLMSLISSTEKYNFLDLEFGVWDSEQEV